MEQWKQIPKWEKYEVSDIGRVRRVGSNVLKPYDRPSKRRLVVTLSDSPRLKDFMVCHLVLLTFVGPCPDNCYLSRHLDDDYKNNRPDNLIWGTGQQKAYDRYKNGLAAGLIKAKLTKEQALEIFHSTDSVKEIMRKFNVKDSTVRRIKLRERYNWIHDY